MAVLEVQALTKAFGTGSGAVEALQGVDLAVEEGEIFGVVGPSGSGKSTFLRCLNLLEKPTSGRVIYRGRDLTGLTEKELRSVRREMGIIFQSFNLMSSRTAAGNVAFPLEAAGMPGRAVRSRTAELLEMVGLSDKAAFYPAQLSGGQKQRVGIARALACRPPILLSDEATSALDPQSTRAVLSLISTVQKQLNLTVILITHEMRVITEICDRVAVMENGLVVESGEVTQVFARPEHRITRSFVRDILGAAVMTGDYVPKGRLLKLDFLGQSADDAVFSRLGRDFGVEVHLLKAQVDRLKGAPLGTVIIDLAGEEAKISQAAAFLETQAFQAEAL
jgi:D-methionine transport system ATP-binding protein